MDLNVKLLHFGKITQEKNLQSPQVNKEFLNLTSNGLSIKGKTDKLDFIRIKLFCSRKGPGKRMKSQIKN